MIYLVLGTAAAILTALIWLIILGACIMAARGDQTQITAEPDTLDELDELWSGGGWRNQ